jgi:hypothetical protein
MGKQRGAKKAGGGTEHGRADEGAIQLQGRCLRWSHEAIDDAVVAQRLEHAVRKEWPCGCDASTDDDERQVQRVDEVGESDAEVGSELLEGDLRAAVAVPGEFCDLQWGEVVCAGG